MRNVWNRLQSVSCRSISGGMEKPWRSAASLIIAAPSERTTGEFSTDYRILFLKRAAKSSFFPNAYVYPGGVLDESDKNPKWIDIFLKVDPSFCDKASGEFFAKQQEGKRIDLFPGDKNALKNGILPNEIAFRICAIRESFEESGLLLLTDDPESRRTSPDVIQAKSVASLLPNDRVEMWRKRIHDDAKEFMNLCLQLESVPDIWSLKEWFHWLTPIIPGSEKGKRRRFDTVFYSCCLQEAPSYFHHDKMETTDSIWIPPAEMMQMFISKHATLAPPQIIETLKLLNFSTIRSLSFYTTQRALKGLERWLPYFYFTKDGKLLEVWPGDDLYPEDPDEFGTRDSLIVLPKTLGEIKASRGSKFHCVLDNNDPVSVINTMSCNITIPNGQISPMMLRTSKDSLTSRL